MIEKDKYLVDGARFKAYRKDLGLTQQQISHCLGVDQSYISKIENGEKNLSLETFTRTTNLFLCEAPHLTQPGSRPRHCHTTLKARELTNQSWHKITEVQSIIAAQYTMETLLSQDAHSSQTVHEMYQNSHSMAQAEHEAQQKQYGKATTSAHVPTSAQLEPTLEDLLANLPSRPLQNHEIPFFAQQLRLFLGIADEPAADLFKLVLEKIPNLTIIFEELEEKITGICYQGQHSHVIVLNQALSRADQRRALIHELFLLFYDQQSQKTISTTDKSHLDSEQRAHLFALYFLLPNHLLAQYLHTHQAYAPNCDQLRLILELENYFQISHAVALERLAGLYDTSKTPTDAQLIRQLVAQYGLDESLYAPHTPERKTNGYYLSQIVELYKSNLFTDQEIANFLQISQNYSSDVQADPFKHIVKFLATWWNVKN